MNEQTPIKGRAKRLAGGVALVLAAMLLVPASGMAGPKFGADLTDDPDPVSTAEACPGGPGWCTRVPLAYTGPGPAATLYAPQDGTIDKIRLISDDPGWFYPQVVKVKGNVAPITEIKVKDQGGLISYAGTGEIEKFDVDLPVKTGQRVAMRGANAGPLDCHAGVDAEAIADPSLSVGLPFDDADYYSGCVHLIQAVMAD